MAYFANARQRAASFEPDPSHLLTGFTAVVALFLAALLAVEGAKYSFLLVGGLATAALVAAHPRYGIYVITGLIFVSDMHITDPNTPTGGVLFKSLATQGILLTPIELLIALSLAGLLARLALDDEVSWRPGHLLIALAMLMLATAIGIGLGMSRGADMSALRAETRGLFYLPILYLVATHFITSRSHLTSVFWVVVIAGNVMAAENVYRYFTYVRNGYELELAPSLAFSHESALFSAAVIILLMSRLVWSGNIAAEWKTLLLLPLPILALLVMRRRAGMVALDAGLILLCLVLLKDNFKMFLVVVPIAAVFLGLLLVMTWNNPGGSGTFARSFRAATGEETINERDQSSDDYRTLEALNVRLNIESDPVRGLGFGRPYAFYVPMADLSFWELWRYVPHNSILWFWMKAGILGFVSLSALIAVAIMRSMHVMQAQKDDLKAYGFAFGAMVVMFVLYSWVDLGLVTPRTVIFFGLVLGMIGALGYIRPDPPPDEKAAV